MALMIESGFPGCRAVAIAWLSRSTAARRAAESSVIVRETSVAVSMARSAMPGWVVDSGCSIFTVPCPRAVTRAPPPMRPPPLAIRASARFEQRVKDLWLSARGAVVNGGWRPRIKKCGAGSFVPAGLCINPQNNRESPNLSFARHPGG